MIERNAGYELNEGREPVQDEQDWLRAQPGASHSGGRGKISAAPVSYVPMGGNSGGITRGLLKVYES